jgi:fluoroacetyl-CoA thioesterase
MLPPALATPIMILAMENPALNAIREYLEPSDSAVGNGRRRPPPRGD